jgi:hypothetical protein
LERSSEKEQVVQLEIWETSVEAMEAAKALPPTTCGVGLPSANCFGSELVVGLMLAYLVDVR